MIIGVGFVVTGWLVPTVDQVKGEWLQLLLAIPLIPIIARRLHDQDRSAWFALIVPVAVGLKAYAYWLYEAGRIPAPKLGFPFNILEGSLTIVIFAIILWPGTDGANRFGNDPRLEA